MNPTDAQDGSRSSSWRELKALFDEVADIDWRRPEWFGLLGVCCALEKLARKDAVPAEELYSRYLGADGGPHTDTFMAQPRRLPAGTVDVEAACRAAVRCARVGLSAIAETQERLGARDLLCIMQRERGWLRREPLDPSSAAAAFLTPRGTCLIDLGSRSDTEVSDELRDFVLDRASAASPVAPECDAPLPAALAVSLVERAPSVGRHLHRETWTRGGGPWLGIGRGDDLDLCTTCHLAIDGYGHGLLTKLILERCRPASIERGPAPDPERVEPLGVAFVECPRDIRLPDAAYALGKTLDRFHRSDRQRASARFSPTFQIPVAPGPSDPNRLMRRVLHGLFSVRMSGGRFERPEEFKNRFRPAIAREIEARGLLTRLLRSTLSSPLPGALRRRLLAARALPDRLAPVAVLGGRGRLSSIRFEEQHRPNAPTFAVSAPALHASLRDPGGGLVLTLVHGRSSCSASLAGTGLAGSSSGARAILDHWLEALPGTTSNLSSRVPASSASAR